MNRLRSTIVALTTALLLPATFATGGALAAAPAPTLTPLRSMTTPATLAGTTKAGHMLAATSNEVTFMQAYGWVADTTIGSASGTLGYVYDQSVPGTVPVYRVWNATLTTSFYVTSKQVADGLVAYGGTNQGVIGYAYTRRAPGTARLRYFYKAATTDSYYATSSTGAAWAVSNGFTEQSSSIYIPTRSDLPYYEIGDPTGSYAGATPRGVMLVIHGGGWDGGADKSDRSVGPAYVAGRAWMADNWRARGWLTVNLDYHSGGGASQVDTQWFYDQIRAWRGASEQVCATGDSAGGHLSLMLAARNPRTATAPGLACVISLAGPTDIATNPATQTALNGFVNTAWKVPGGTSAAARTSMLRASSPVTYRSTMTAKILLATGADDLFIPAAQMAALAAPNYAAGHACTLQPQPAYATSTNRAAFIHTWVLDHGATAPYFDFQSYLTQERGFGEAVLAGTSTSSACTR